MNKAELASLCARAERFIGTQVYIIIVYPLAPFFLVYMSSWEQTRSYPKVASSLAKTEEFCLMFFLVLKCKYLGQVRKWVKIKGCCQTLKSTQFWKFMQHFIAIWIFMNNMHYNFLYASTLYMVTHTNLIKSFAWN